MSLDNYSILTRNTLDGFSEGAGILYLNLLDAYEGHNNAANERRAFFAACDYEDVCGGTLDFVFRNNPLWEELLKNPHVVKTAEETISDLSEFFAKRWQHNFVDRAERRKNMHWPGTPKEFFALFKEAMEFFNVKLDPSNPNPHHEEARGHRQGAVPERKEGGERNVRPAGQASSHPGLRMAEEAGRSADASVDHQAELSRSAGTSQA